ncbi:MAG: hypothetical protein K8U57_29870 [Planctomycetes bacterium]|nr:hypothetical protein [Planctomycetota bacterium]
MIPNNMPADRDAKSNASDDSRPCIFLDAAYDPTDDYGDWWLDLGSVHLPA